MLLVCVVAGGPMSANDCYSSAVCCVCVWVCACVHMWHGAFHIPRGRSFCHRDSCIIMHQIYTKLMTIGYVGQARMMPQTYTKAHWQTLGYSERLNRLEPSWINRKKKKNVRRNAAGNGLMDKRNKTLKRIYYKGEGRGVLTVVLDFSISVIH